MVALALSACGGEDQASARVAAAPVLEVAVGPVDVEAAEPPPTATTTTTTAEPADPCAGRVDRLDAGLEPVPERLRDRLAFVLASPMWGDVDRSISVWVDGFGEVLAQGADERLLPASNQKIFTAVGVALELHPDARFETSVHQQGNDLVLVAGGDPTLSATGTHALAELARQVAA
ncbi:MAG: D-alanyl-D-alanine carboxypeptidase, partial [Acidimicrobiia bacterium]|nr:D-alanyl-D-alanine carboxypeptidase [Acidimicrobiia bacterium]